MKRKFKSKLGLQKKATGNGQSIASMFKKQINETERREQACSSTSRNPASGPNNNSKSDDDDVIFVEMVTESPYLFKRTQCPKSDSSTAFKSGATSSKEPLTLYAGEDERQKCHSVTPGSSHSHSNISQHFPTALQDKTESYKSDNGKNDLNFKRSASNSNQSQYLLSCTRSKSSSRSSLNHSGIQEIRMHIDDKRLSEDNSPKKRKLSLKYSKNVTLINATGTSDSIQREVPIFEQYVHLSTSITLAVKNNSNTSISISNSDDIDADHSKTSPREDEETPLNINEDKNIDYDNTLPVSSVRNDNINNKAASSASDEDQIQESSDETFKVPYYLQNFETILNSVMDDETYTELFNTEDLQTISSYRNLSEAAKKLYIRIFSRKLNWISLTKLNYPEIAVDLQPALNELSDSRLIHTDDNLTDLQEVLNALSAGDVKSLSKSYHISTSVTQKPMIIQELIKTSQQSTLSSMFGSTRNSIAEAMLKRAKKYIREMYRLKSKARSVFVRVMMLFSLLDTSGDDESGNGGQGQLFHLLMVNIGKWVYPTYSVCKVHRIFRGREDVIRFEKALQLESDLLSCTQAGNWKDAFTVYQRIVEEKKLLDSDQDIVRYNHKLPDFLRSYTATSVIYRLLNVGIEILQRQKDFKAAIKLLRQLLSQDLYCYNYRGHWWERLALNLDAHMKQPEESLKAVSAGLTDQHVKTGHRYALYLRAEMICQRPKLKLKHKLSEFHHEPVKDLPKVFLEGRVIHQGVNTAGTRFILTNGDNPDDMTVVGVEEFVLDHYHKNGYTAGIHAEGSIVGCLFSLFFWDIIFMDIPDAFHSPFQSQPLDLHSDLFYENRRDAVEQRLEKINASSIEALHVMASETWVQHEDVLYIGMNWERMRSIDFIKGLISCMGGKVLSGIVGRSARCPRHTRGGFPDLTLWNTETGGLKICEVKGPGDRLSNKQILWIDYLLGLGVDAEVCHVKAVAAKKLKK